MKWYWAVLVSTTLLTPAVALAQDGGFASSSEDIIQQLTAAPRHGASRSFSPGRPDAAEPGEQLTRSITIRVNDQVGELDKEMQVPVKQDDTGVARLKVEFDVNSARLRSDAYGTLDQLGMALSDERVAGRTVCIKGHTDSDGSEKYNLGLSYERADSVRNYVLTHHGLSADHLFVVGYGEQLPLAENNRPENKQLNRRVEIILDCPEAR